MDSKLAKEVIYLLFRIHQVAAYSVRNPNPKTVIGMLRATTLSKELKAWLNDRQGKQTDQTFLDAVNKMFQGSEVKI